MRVWHFLGRFATLYVIGYLVLSAATAYSIFLVRHQAAIENYERCRVSEMNRAALVGTVRQFRDALVAASQSSPQFRNLPPDRQAIQRRQAEAFVADIDRRLAPLKPLECGTRP